AGPAGSRRHRTGTGPESDCLSGGRLSPDTAGGGSAGPEPSGRCWCRFRPAGLGDGAGDSPQQPVPGVESDYRMSALSSTANTGAPPPQDGAGREVMLKL